MPANFTGSLAISGSLVLTGSISTTGTITISGSILSASYASNAELLDNLDSTSFVYTSSFNTYSSSMSTRVTNLESTASVLTSASASFSIVSASYSSASSSLSTRTTNLETTASVLITASASFAVVSSSFATTSGSDSIRITNLESTASVLTTASASFSVVSSSFATTSGSLSTRVTTIEGSYATTGSNIFVGTQGINNSSNAISFTSTASLYVDGGARITRDLYVSGTSYFNNVTIYGTQSVNYITSSQLNIGTNIITVNTDTPTVRYGGLAVYDSGSTGLTGSILWDSENNHWIYTNPSASTYSGGMLISGPRASARGCEVGTTACSMMMGQGGDHITSSAIFHYGNTTCFYGNSMITSTGVGCFSGAVCSPSIVGGTVSGTTSTFINGIISGTPANTSSLLLENFNGDQTATTLRLKSGRADVFYHMQAFSSNTSEVFRIESSGRVVGAAGACFAGTICGGTGVFGNTGAGSFSLSITNNDQSNARIRLTNTGTGGGIFSLVAGNPGASNDGLAIYDENCSATRVYISSAGNVGICTTSTATKLALNSYTGARLPYINGTNNTFDANGITVGNSNNGNTNIGGGIDFTNNCYCIGAYSPILSFSSVSSNYSFNNAYAGIWGVLGAQGVDANWVAGHLVFGSGGGAGITERMRITSTGIACFACTVCAPMVLASGCVGIGTNDPIDRLMVCGVDSGLYISNSTRSRINLHTCGCGSWQIETNNTGGNQPGGALGITEAGVGSKFHMAKGGVACFQNTVCMPVLLASGCVGINTTAPDSLLHVLNTSNTPYSDANTLASGQWFRVSNPSTCTGATSGILFVASGPSGGNGLATINGVTTSCGSMAITFGTRDASGNVTERMRVASGGNVGIGTTSPCAHLHVYAAAGPSLWLSSGGSGTGGLRIIKGDSGTAYINNQDNVGMQFQIAGNTRLTIDSSASTFSCQVCAPAAIITGCLGLNCTSPGQLLTVNGVSSFKCHQQHPSGQWYKIPFNIEKGTGAVATTKCLIVIDNNDSFQELHFTIEYGSRLQGVSDSYTQTSLRTYGVNRFNSGTIAVNDTYLITGGSGCNINTHAPMTVAVVGTCMTVVKVDFSCSATHSSFVWGEVRIWSIESLAGKITISNNNY